MNHLLIQTTDVLAARTLLFSTRYKARYWTHKYTNALFHPNKWGGRRHARFSSAEKPLVRNAAWTFITTQNDVSLQSLAEHLSEAFSRPVSVSLVQRLTVDFRWSWRIPSHVQINKFTLQNLQWYAHFAYTTQDLDWTRVKFADECHVVSRNLRNRKVLGVVGQRTWVPDNTLHTKSITITLMVSLSTTTPVVYNITENSNTQWDFTFFVSYCIQRGFLVAGDILFVDNACIHNAIESFSLLCDICSNSNVRLMFLPAYSPEFNPCELIFNVLKKDLRNRRVRALPIWLNCVNSLAKITTQQICSFYDHCLLLENIVKKINYLNRCLVLSAFFLAEKTRAFGNSTLYFFPPD